MSHPATENNKKASFSNVCFSTGVRTVRSSLTYFPICFWLPFWRLEPIGFGLEHGAPSEGTCWYQKSQTKKDFRKNHPANITLRVVISWNSWKETKPAKKELLEESALQLFRVSVGFLGHQFSFFATKNQVHSWHGVKHSCWLRLIEIRLVLGDLEGWNVGLGKAKILT